MLTQRVAFLNGLQTPLNAFLEGHVGFIIGLIDMVLFVIYHVSGTSKKLDDSSQGVYCMWQRIYMNKI